MMLPRDPSVRLSVRGYKYDEVGWTTTAPGPLSCRRAERVGVASGARIRPRRARRGASPSPELV